MTIEEHLYLGRKWLASQSSVIYCNGTDYFGEEVFGFCNEVIVGDSQNLYVCGEFCGKYDSINDMVEGIVSRRNTDAIYILEKNERSIEIGDWVMKKVKLNEGILKNYCENIWARHDGDRICLMMNSSDDAIRIGEFLGVGSDCYGNGIHAFNEECLDVLDRLCELGTLEYYKNWKRVWNLLVNARDGGYKPFRVGDNFIELVGEAWIGDRLESLSKEKGGRKIIEFDDFEELETMVNLVKE